MAAWPPQTRWTPRRRAWCPNSGRRLVGKTEYLYIYVLGGAMPRRNHLMAAWPPQIGNSLKQRVVLLLA